MVQIMRHIIISIILYMCIACQPFEYNCGNNDYDWECECVGTITGTTQVLDDEYYVCAANDSTWYRLSK